MQLKSIAIALACACISPALLAAAPALSPVQQLDQLLNEQWQYALKESPELATTIGDDRYNTQWTNYSPEHVASVKARTEDFLHRFQALNLAGADEQSQLSQAMMIRQLKDQLESIRLKNYEMPLDQVAGAQLAIPGFVSTIPFDSVQHYQDYIARLHGIPKVLADLTAASRLGLKDHLMQPRYLLDKVAVQLQHIADPAGLANVFGQPAAQFPASIPAAEQARLRQTIVQVVDQEVRPAFARMAEFVRRDYAPYGRVHEGLWSLPDGAERYRFAIHTQTTTEMSPAEIHRLGLEQVAHIEAEMTRVATQLGYKDLAALRKAVASDPRFFATSREQILDTYRHYVAGMLPHLPQYFGHLPKTELKVQAVEAYREKEAADAEYHQGTPDGSRPGIIFVDTADYSKRSLYVIEDTAYHEGVPGHHLQISIAQSLPLPPFRQQAGYNAYIEGWALYAEGLAKEMGFYKDPYNYYGYLNGQLLRADRLVLDTGVHYMRWTRQQMIDFFEAHPAEDEPSIQAETDRYVAWPGQALGYMIGELKIQQLRKRAEQALGPRFDIRAFHDEILDGGAMPLEMLDTRVSRWISTQQHTGSAK
ncbi:DUF885 domain-containing protein [Frateuria aurantia]